jgi:hypothetical protein
MLYSETDPTEGSKEGVAVGEEVDPDDGKTVGRNDGTVEGRDDAAVGPVLGATVDGAAVGPSLGATEDGAAVGPSLGATVDGVAEGPSLGAAVDLHVHYYSTVLISKHSVNILIIHRLS